MKDKAYQHFKDVDQILYEVAIRIELPNYSKPDDPFTALIESIISQQLSIKASDTIFGRFKKLFPNGKITPIKLLEIPDQKIRDSGISFSKIKYIKGIAEAIINKQIDLNKFDDLSNEEVTLELIKLKGIGQWTAEMFLMFTLNRPDVFSTGDLGLQNAIVKLYNLESKPNRDKLLEISNKWSPFKTTASRILWRSLEL